MKKHRFVPTVMNSTKKQLLTICEDFLRRYDDYIQEAEDMNRPDVAAYFEQSFNELEMLYKHFENFTPTVEMRNHMRSLLKQSERVVVILTLKARA